jgi:hypothetical protein
VNHSKSCRPRRRIAEHFTRRWQAAGLIDARWPRASLPGRPGIAGLGAIAVSLGIMALVGANRLGLSGSRILTRFSPA